MRKRLPQVLAALVVVCSFIFGIHPFQSHAASSFNSYSYGGGWTYKVYVPDSYTGSTSVPMVVMLHGCLQNADDFAAGTGMNQLANEKDFIVLYPEMNSLYNSYDCWNWFYDYNQHRGEGEAAIIGDMMQWVTNNYDISDQIYVAGMSAGGYMASVLAATYPDYIKAVGIHSGGMYNAADTAAGATYAMTYGSAYDPNSAGYDAASEMSLSSLHRMPVVIFHGTNDTTVNFTNALQSATQWAATNDYADDGIDNNSVDNTYDQSQSGTTNGYSWDKYTYDDANGSSLIELWEVHGLGHAWSGGNPNGSYTDPSGPNASEIMWNFFVSHK